MSTGYSGTPLVKKLGIQSGFHIAFVHAPDGYSTTLGELPQNIAIHEALDGGQLDFVQAFYTLRIDFEADFLQLKNALKRDGMLWISWPKKVSKVPTDLNENIVRETALANGLVDVKVAAVDAIWSGLKLVYRLKDR